MIGGRSVLAVVTARGGSKGVPGKNILPIGGRPLIEWTIDAARASRYIDRLILSSDDEAIIAAALRAGCEAPFRRSAALAGDAASSIDVVVDALERVPGHDIVVLLQPTSPLRSTADIDGTLELLEASGAPSCVSLRAADEHPYWTYRLDADGRLARYAEPPAGMPLRRQDLPPAWCLNGAVYAARTGWFLRQRSFLSPQTAGYPMPAERSLDIDTPADVELLKTAVQSLRPLPNDRPEAPSTR
ncbi:cytidylyltransferase domain-containing protein [Janthinobacterium fluminis]|uniref:Acylneuraminate cytidylyltransferase family protein n=1 Tax=Janthinobacterium fluminis TaxID=2987524 RepID=A0ABT5K1N0_9BURK|nr:acylneuraminate cytidylyltransferase family protein [Janthinobacterium fluminis]MDC8758883.1 acylneuraminate cytidylyltransferase family protein [Janthinobacterium fluminis]